MAKYKILNKDVKRNIYEFLVDKTSDLNSLPKAAGSTALVADNGERYICNNAKEWKVLSNNSNNNTDNNTNNSNNTDNSNNGILAITFTNSGIDATFNEMKEAFDNGMYVILFEDDDPMYNMIPLLSIGINNDDIYYAAFLTYDGLNFNALKYYSSSPTTLMSSSSPSSPSSPV